MPEETKNSAASGEWKHVPMAQLKKWHRDLDACQKVMWLRGGFDPAYCMDAQDCLKEMDSVLAAPAPPAGGVQFIGYPPVPEDRKLLAAGEKADMTVGDKRNPFHNPAIADGYASGWNSRNREVTRLLVETAALQQRLKVADQRVDDLESDLAAARELLKHGSSPTPAHCESVLDFLARKSAPFACIWTYSEDEFTWHTSCGQAWSFTEDGPKENGVKFCHSCGKPLEVAPAAEADSDE